MEVESKLYFVCTDGSDKAKEGFLVILFFNSN